MKVILLNKWIRAEGGVATALVGIPAASVTRIEQADQYNLTTEQRENCRAAVSVKSFGIIYVRETVEQVAEALNGGK